MNKIIEKAVKGGFLKSEADYFLRALGEWHKDSAHNKVIVTAFIFQIPFLKAYFGEDFVCKICGADVWRKYGAIACTKCDNQLGTEYIKSWQYHAQQFVLSTDRKEYLERFL